MFSVFIQLSLDIVFLLGFLYILCQPSFLGFWILSPLSLIEDVVVRVKHFIFLADFVVMDICEDTDIPVILGRPFMLTASCIVDMGRRTSE